MFCPKCGGKTRVVDYSHINDDNSTYRKRKCNVCSHVFYTCEFEVDRDEQFRNDWMSNHRKNK